MREAATSREIATSREVADRSNQYILEKDWMIWQKATSFQSHIHSIYEYIQYPNPITIQFLYCCTDQFRSSTAIASCVNWPASDGKCRGLTIAPTEFQWTSDYDAKKRIYMIFKNINKSWNKQLLTFVVDGINSNVYSNKINIKESLVHTCENFILESSDFNWAWPGIAYSVSQSFSHFQIWDKALSSVEIEYCYDLLFSGKSLLGTEDGLVCYFPCQEGLGNLITDIMGEKTGTLTGAEWRNYGGLREAV